MYIDCHAHLFFSPIPKDSINQDIEGEIPNSNIEYISRVVSNAKNKGVKYIVGVISNPQDLHNYQNQMKFENVIHIIGISRGNALKDHSEMIKLLEEEISIKEPQGIGEIGLDYSYGFESLNNSQKSMTIRNQQELLRKQIRIAKEHDIPIVVHAGYGTDKDLVEILLQEGAHDIGGQIHGYMSDKVLVSKLLDLGFFFSFGYLHPRDKELREIVQITPLEQLLTETDSPYHVMDIPKKFILPEDVILVAKDIAEVKEITIKAFTKQVLKNAKNLFRF